MPRIPSSGSASSTNSTCSGWTCSTSGAWTRAYSTNGYSTRPKIVRTLRRINTVVIDVDGHELTARTPLDDDSQAILTAIAAGH